METGNKSFLSVKQLEIVQKAKKYFLRIGVYILIGGVILGAVLILTGGTQAGEYISKTMGMFLVFAVMMLVSSNNFKILENNRKGTQGLALLGLVMNFVWGILWALLIWQVFDLMTYKTCAYNVFSTGHLHQCTDGYSVMGKITLIATYLSMLGFFGSNILYLKEYDRRSAIMPLKITSIVCLSYCVAYAIFMTLTDLKSLSDDSGRFAMLSGFAGVVWVVTWIMAAIFSRGARKRSEAIKNARNGSVGMNPAVDVQSEGVMRPEETVQPREIAQPTINTESEAEMRARIENKVLKEVEIEKEIRERLEKEKQEKN